MLRKTHRGLTLVEMLVAMAVTLIMMGAVVTLFGNVGDSIAGSRASIEVSQRLTNVRNRLQTDLQGITARTLPPLRPENDEGYLEIIEGPASDAWPDLTNYPWTPTLVQPTSPTGADTARTAITAMRGDADDAILFTTRSRGEPFVGRAELDNNLSTTETIESQTAEIIWYLAQAPSTQPLIDPTSGVQFTPLTLYRRVLLINPSLSPSGINANAGNILADSQQASDLSMAQPDASGTTLTLNTLGDLTKRENRWRHNNTNTFPYATANPFVVNNVAPLGVRTVTLTGGSGTQINRTGDDVVLTNVLAFDVQVYDPQAPVRQLSTANNVQLSPSDWGYCRTANPVIAVGSYVDLFYSRYLPQSFTGNEYLLPHPTSTPPAPFPTKFSHAGELPSKLNATSGSQAATYDTWSLHYENDQIDENSDSVADAGTNGLDDNNNGLVDEVAEFDTLPPYPSPLRGIQIKIRVYEPDSKQVREVTVVHDFLPE